MTRFEFVVTIFLIVVCALFGGAIFIEIETGKPARVAIEDYLHNEPTPYFHGRPGYFHWK